jgi:hypothetical protein
VKYYRFMQGRHFLFQYAIWPRYWRLGFFIAWNSVGIQVPPICFVYNFRGLDPEHAEQWKRG